MTTTSNTLPAKTLADIAINDAVKAVANNDRATWNAVNALALVMVGKQFEMLDSDKGIDEAKNKAAFRHFTKVYAMRGNVVWRGTENLLDVIMAKRGAEREKAVNAYIDGVKKGESHPAAKPEGAKYNEGLAKLRTWSFRLMSDVCTNEQDIVREIRALRDSGATAELQVTKFRDFVATRYGDTFAKLAHNLAKDSKKKDGVDAIESMLKKAGEMNDSDLQRLVSGLQALWSERQASLAEMVEMTGGETGETPELIPADVAEAA